MYNPAMNGKAPLLVAGAAVAAAALLLHSAGVPPARAGTAAVSEKTYEDTSVGYSIRPISSWEPLPKKNPDDPTAQNEAGGWYSKDKEWPGARCTVLKFGTYFAEESKPVATESGGPGGDKGGDKGGGKGEGDGGDKGGGAGGDKGGGEGGADPAAERGPRTAKELFGKGPQSFEEWIALVKERNKHLNIDLNPVKAKFGDDDGFIWEGSIRSGSDKTFLYGASVKRNGFEVAVLYEGPDGKNFVRDLKGAYKSSVRSLLILPESKMRKAQDALAKKIAGFDPEAAWAEKAIAALPPGWTSHKTPHYVILYDKSIDTTTPGLIARIANQLERIRAQVYEPLFPAARPVTALSIVKVTQDPKQYMAYGAPAGSGGYWSWPSRELVFFCLPNGQQSGVDVTLDVLNHEGFHQYIFYAVGQVSPHSWYNEGHGDYFAGFTLKEGKFTRGKFSWRQKIIQAAIENRTYVPLKDFLKFSQAEYYQRGGDRRKGGDIGQNYSQGWSVIWFLRTTKDPRYTSILDRYFNTMKAAVTEWRAGEEEAAKKDGREPAEIMPPKIDQKIAEDSLKAGFEGVDIDQLEKDWVASKPY
jgi:hypothetical protein